MTWCLKSGHWCLRGKPNYQQLGEPVPHIEMQICSMENLWDISVNNDD